ncbi:MAG: alkaline phosphatase D family protein [Gemmataceae bacterium]
MRSAFLGCAFVFLMGHAAMADEPALSRIVFGSGLSTERPQLIWNAILETRPEVFIFVGDAVFLDTDMQDVMKSKYAQLAASPGFQELKNSCPVLATWGGHDYGAAGAGANFREKAISSKLFREFWDLKNAPAEGNYSARTFGPSGKRVQIIMLDTRYFRVPTRKGGDGTQTPATLLGEAQWKWFTEQLNHQAELRLVCTPTPINNAGPGESWVDYPEDFEQLKKVLRETKASGVVFLSGERSGAELSLTELPANYAVFELTSHGLNIGSKQWHGAPPNPKRIGVLAHGDNFGSVLIDWARPDPEIRLQGRDVTGDVVFQEKIELSMLRTPGSTRAAEAPKVVATPTLPSGTVSPAEATKRVGDKVTVQFAVKGTGATRDKGRVFLNSSDARDASNFTIMIDMKKAGESLQKAGITDPREHFKNKTVRVTGTVTTFKDAPQIAVEDASQIQVVEK